MTYNERKIFKFDNNLKQIIQEIEMPKEIREGWGMCVYNKDTLLVSDGSNRIFHINAHNFSIKKIIEVPQYKNLNELEMVKGNLFINIFMSPYIIVINPESGKVLEQLDFSQLEKQLYQEINLDYEAVMNGIAYHEETDTLLLTGKLWPYIYQIQLIKS
ncbi:hypothetical protein IMG5_109230 [Ichthyophthirius multifiliis]|uniref:Glutamine cyclotransferase n=1 Tax=Ichthyophthirius multifiliis TaxID=5932 RepID=G0QTJ3_ICHMU|nr:hypothetical protein IMG5_109230 [Ichthyophthirius multifiliis]EGR31464.1 hypothetical protein IMG5_109230 [Ichthyophthirius multifiliis]|eukprot:XP_004034950.1 hypothetical protein IMG5_109230 [Ichthyophthirius multifiliis]